MDLELQRKLDAVTRQHEIDKLFEMEDYNFWSGLGEAQIRQAYINKVEGYPRQKGAASTRWQLIDDEVFNTLINGIKKE